MRSSDVVAGNSALASDYNNLRKDAAGSGYLLVHEQNTPDMTLKVEAGVCYINNTQVVYAGGNTPAMVAPAANPRIDLITIDSAGTIAVVTGTEAASPAVPAYLENKIVLAEVYHTVAETVLKDSSDATNGYIQRDSRPFLENQRGFKSRIRVYKDAAQTIVAGGVRIVVFSDELDDTYGEFDNATNYRFTATEDGFYLVNANVLLSASYADEGLYVLYIYRLGSVHAQNRVHTSGIGAFNLDITKIVKLTAGQYIDIRIDSASGSNYTVSTAYLEIHRLS